MPALIKYVTAEAPMRPGVVKYVVPGPARSRDRSRSAEAPVTPVLQYVAVGAANCRGRSRSAETPVMPAVLQYVAGPPRSSSRSCSTEVPMAGVPLHRAHSRERSSSVRVPVTVVSPQRAPPPPVLCYVPPPVDNSPVDSLCNTESLVESRSTEKDIKSTVPQHYSSLEGSEHINAPDAGPKVEVKPQPQEKVRAGSKKRFLDASSGVSRVLGAETATMVSSVKDLSQDGAAWGAEELSAGTVKLRWQAGCFSVVDKQEKNECPEAAPEPLARYFDGVLEVEAVDLPALRGLLASDLGVDIGDQPGTGLTGAVVIAGPELFAIAEVPSPEVVESSNSSNSCRTFSFPVLVRHPGFPCEATVAEHDKNQVKVEVTSLKQAMPAAPQWVDPSYYLDVEDIQVDDASAKLCAAEQKALQAEEERTAAQEWAIAAEKDHLEQKLKAEAAKTKEEEAMVKSTVAEQKAVEAEAERDAAHQRAIAAERERDDAKAKWEVANIELAQANAKAFAAERKAVQAEQERDVARVQISVAEQQCEEQRVNNQMTEEERNAAYDFAAAAEKERLEEKVKAEKARTNLEEAMASSMAAEQMAVEAEAERDAAQSRALAADRERNEEKARLEDAKIEMVEANAKVSAAEEKAAQAEEERDAAKARTTAAEKERDDAKLNSQMTEEDCNAAHSRAVAAEKERFFEKVKAEEAMVKAKVAEHKVVEAEAERDAAQRRAKAAETELGAERRKAEIAKIEVAAANAKVRAAKLLVVRAEEERDAAIAAEKERQIMANVSQASTTLTTPELFDISQGDTPAFVESPSKSFCFPAMANLHQTISGDWCADGSDIGIGESTHDCSGTEAYTSIPAEADNHNFVTVEEIFSVVAKPRVSQCREVVCNEHAEVESTEQTASRPTDTDYPDHLQTEAAFAHAYLPVDQYVNLVLSEFPSTKATAKNRQ